MSDLIERLSGAWKPASVRPEKEGKYLALWSMTKKSGLIYEILNYGTYADWKDGLKERFGWWDFEYGNDVTDFTDNVRYWMELPDVPEAEE